MSSEINDHSLCRVAVIRKGHCSTCDADLIDLIEDLKKGLAQIPKNCPQCQAIFPQHHVVTEEVETYKCDKCKTKIPAGGPSENIYCRHCGAFLIWQEKKQEAD